MRMRLGLLQDPAVIDRQIAKEVAAAEAARKRSQAPTVKTEAETKAEEAMTKQEREAAKKKIEAAHKPRIRPLSETKAIEMGANFAAETFIFAVGIGVIVFEQWRQRRKARNQRDDIREDLEELQVELKTVKAELEEMKARHPESATGKLLGFWKGKNEAHKSEEKPQSKKMTPSGSETISAMQTPPPTQAGQPRVVQAGLEETEGRHSTSVTEQVLGFWKGKTESQKAEKKTQAENNTASDDEPLSPPQK